MNKRLLKTLLKVCATCILLFNLLVVLNYFLEMTVVAKRGKAWDPVALKSYGFEQDGTKMNGLVGYPLYFGLYMPAYDYSGDFYSDRKIVGSGIYLWGPPLFWPFVLTLVSGLLVLKWSRDSRSAYMVGIVMWLGTNCLLWNIGTAVAGNESADVSLFTSWFIPTFFAFIAFGGGVLLATLLGKKFLNESLENDIQEGNLALNFFQGSARALTNGAIVAKSAFAAQPVAAQAATLNAMQTTTPMGSAPLAAVRAKPEKRVPKQIQVRACPQCGNSKARLNNGQIDCPLCRILTKVTADGEECVNCGQNLACNRAKFCHQCGWFQQKN